MQRLTRETVYYSELNAKTKYMFCCGYTSFTRQENVNTETEVASEKGLGQWQIQEFNIGCSKKKITLTEKPIGSRQYSQFRTVTCIFTTGTTQEL